MRYVPLIQSVLFSAFISLNTIGSADGAEVTERAARRFLEQAAFGPRQTDVERVMELGFARYIDEQFGVRLTGYPGYLDSTKAENLRERFFSNALHGRDQLRQRMAYALGQIFVVSSLRVTEAPAIASYQRLLLNKAFGTYKDLLREVTLHPTMGRYLDMVNNFSTGHPNENYAREVMQLFSIGTIELNVDGSAKIGADGTPTAAYTQADVEGLARAFTGWTYPVTPGQEPKNENPPYYYGRMQASEPRHDHEAKTILGGVVLPAGQTAWRDLNMSIDTLASHPNVAPYISNRLIQHFVTSNPSPSYIARVANVFNNNGSGVRGDFKAVLKAILLDREARRGDDPATKQSADGRLKDPVLFVTGLLRALNAPKWGQESLWTYTIAMGLNVFSSPSVFNFYSPDNVLPEAGLKAPEFQIHQSPSAMARFNFLNTIIYSWNSPLAIDLSPWIALAGDIPSLINEVDMTLLNGFMTDATRAQIDYVIQRLPANDIAGRAQAALYLAATSPEYFVHH